MRKNNPESTPMPKNKKPAGGRPARNFDPDYAAKRQARRSGPKPGSRSPGHRGYRAPEEEPRKNRWNAAERAERAERAPRYSDEARSPRHFDREERPARRFDREGRPARRFDREERPARRFDREERPARRFDREERSARRFGQDDRPQRRFDRDERPARRFDREERPRRRFDDDRRSHSERPARRFDGERRFDRERPQRRERSDFYPSRDEKPRFTPQDDVVLERLEAEAIQASDVEGVSFADLGLGSNIVRTLGELGAASPFPIQAATIPDVLAGRDVLGRGRTGSGKTIAFGAPLVEKLMENNGGTRREMGRNPRALILAPTRELALQIDRTVQPIARSVGLFTTQIYGGVPQARQVGALRRGVDIVIGTPGRIEDLIQQGRLDLSDVTVTVIDEADHMCDLGFLEPRAAHPAADC